MDTKISVIVPVYKAERYLAQCVDSLVGQTLREIEIILVDDGSPDGCGAICDAYAQRDPRVKVIHQPNQGVSVARNAGLDAAQGEWVTFVDADDWLEPDACEVMHEKAAGAGCDIAMFDMMVCTKTEALPSRFFLEEGFVCGRDRRDALQMNILQPGSGGMGNQRARRTTGSPCAKLIRTAFLQEKGLRYQAGVRRMQDTLFNLYAFEHAESFSYNYIPVYHYRIWGDSACTRYTPDFDALAADVIARIDAFIERFHKPEEFRRARHARVFSLFLELIRLQYVPGECPLTRRERIARIRAHAASPAFSSAIRHVPPSIMGKKAPAVLLARMGLYGPLYDLLALRERRKRRSIASDAD